MQFSYKSQRKKGIFCFLRLPQRRCILSAMTIDSAPVTEVSFDQLTELIREFGVSGGTVSHVEADDQLQSISQMADRVGAVDRKQRARAVLTALSFDAVISLTTRKKLSPDLFRPDEVRIALESGAQAAGREIDQLFMYLDAGNGRHMVELPDRYQSVAERALQLSVADRILDPELASFTRQRINLGKFQRCMQKVAPQRITPAPRGWRS